MCVVWGFGRAARRVPNPPFSATITSTSVAVGGFDLAGLSWARPFHCGNSCDFAFLNSNKRPRFRLNVPGSSLIGNSLLGGGRVVSREDRQLETLDHPEESVIEPSRFSEFFPIGVGDFARPGFLSFPISSACFRRPRPCKVSGEVGFRFLGLAEKICHLLSVVEPRVLVLLALPARTPQRKQFCHSRLGALPQASGLLYGSLPSRAPLLFQLPVKGWLLRGRRRS